MKAGKVRYLGASSMHAFQFAEMQFAAERHGWTRFVAMQNQYNLVYREEEREMIPYCRQEGVGIVPWSPLARGFLAGNRNRQGGGATARAESDAYAKMFYYQDNDFTVAERLAEVAKERGHQAGPGRPRLGAGQARHHLPDRRRHPDDAPGRRAGGARHHPGARRDGPARRTLSAAPHPRIRNG